MSAMAMLRQLFVSPYRLRKHLYRMSIEGGPASEVLSAIPEEGVYLPRVSPDGNLVAMGYQEGDPVPVVKIGVAPAGGGSLRFVNRQPIGAGGLRWAPDGKGLQYILTRSGATNVWEQPLTGGDPHQVTRFTLRPDLWLRLVPRWQAPSALERKRNQRRSSDQQFPVTWVRITPPRCPLHGWFPSWDRGRRGP
jgi:Tol biopolymer transport system component